MPESGLRRGRSRNLSVALEALLMMIVLIAAAALPTPSAPTYIARATVVLVLPANASDQYGRNITTLVDVEVMALTSHATRARLKHQRMSGDYTVKETRDNTPLLTITTADNSAQQTPRDANLILGEVRTALQHFQRGMPYQDQARSVALKPPVTARPATSMSRLLGHHLR